jgi:SAM-dependent methyltransferase
MAKKTAKGVAFWDEEYTNSRYLKLSDEPSEDLEKFVRWVARFKDGDVRQHPKVLDLGCGNGRNLIYLAKAVQARGIGYDTSNAAITAAKNLSEGLPITYTVRSIAGVLDVPDESQDIVLDMMTSHFLSEKDRVLLRDEIFRVLRPGGWLFMKTFLGDADKHTSRLLRESGTEEKGTYVHPVIGVPEHVYFEDELVPFLEEKFLVQQTYKSHRHSTGGKASRRRSISVYAQKDPYAR